jgi:hypothetical protein
MNTHEDTHNNQTERKPPPDRDDNRNRQQRPIWHGWPHRQSWYTVAPQSSLLVLGANPAADAALTIPVAALRHASTNGEVTA